MRLFGRHRRPLHRRRRTLLRGLVGWATLIVTWPAYLLAVTIAIGWGDVLNVFGWATDIAQRIKDVVTEAIGVVWNWVSRALDWTQTQIDTFGYWTQWATNWFTSRIDNLQGWLTNFNQWAVGPLMGWVIDRVNEARAFANDIVNTARGYAAGLYNTAMGAVDNLMRWTIDNVFTVLANWIGATADRLNNLIASIGGQFASVFGWAEDRIWAVARAVVAPYADVYNFVTGDLLPLWRKVRPWLAFLADHPIDWPYIILQETVTRMKSNFLGWILSAVEAEGSVLEDWFVKWLGQ